MRVKRNPSQSLEAVPMDPMLSETRLRLIYEDLQTNRYKTLASLPELVRNYHNLTEGILKYYLQIYLEDYEELRDEVKYRYPYLTTEIIKLCPRMFEHVPIYSIDEILLSKALICLSRDSISKALSRSNIILGTYSDEIFKLVSNHTEYDPTIKLTMEQYTALKKIAAKEITVKFLDKNPLVAKQLFEKVTDLDPEIRGNILSLYPLLAIDYSEIPYPEIIIRIANDQELLREAFEEYPYLYLSRVFISNPTMFPIVESPLLHDVLRESTDLTEQQVSDILSRIPRIRLDRLSSGENE